jgi:hypothetical protein
MDRNRNQSSSSLPSTTANGNAGSPLQGRDSIQNHVRQNFKMVREQGRRRAEQMEQKRLRMERERKEMEELQLEYKIKKERLRELKEMEKELERELKRMAARESSASTTHPGPDGTSKLTLPSTSALSSLPGLLEWDKISGTHAKLSEYLSNIGKINPMPDKKATVDVLPVIPEKRPESPRKELERQKMKELLEAYLSSPTGKPLTFKPAAKKKNSKVFKKSSLLTRLAAPTHSSLAKQTKKWNSKDDKDVASAPPPTAAGPSVACSKPKSSTSGHEAGCVCERHRHRFPDFKP